MRICDGEVIGPGTANVKQLFHLGQIIGQMHKILNDHQQSKFPLHWDILSKESMAQTLAKKMGRSEFRWLR